MVLCVAAKEVGENAKKPGKSLLWQYHTRVASCEKQLMEQFGEAEQTILTKLIRSQHEINGITALENFILGFRLGVRIMAECMDENDGDIRSGGG